MNRSDLLLPCALMFGLAPVSTDALADQPLTPDAPMWSAIDTPWDADALALALLVGQDAVPGQANEQAGDPQRRPGTARIYWENDGAFHDPFDSYDRHYTNGFAIVLEHQPSWAERAADWMPFGERFEKNHGGTKTGAGYVLSQLIFTPADLTAAGPITTDQPYAGYLYGGVFWQRQSGREGPDNDSVLDHFEINIGMVGDQAIGEDIQEWVHTNFEGLDPGGWDNQLASEMTAQFYYRRKWRIDLGSVESSLLGDLEMQLIPQAGFALGTVYRYAETAATFRIGYHLPDDFGPGRINDLQSTTGDVYKHDGWSWYVFGRAGGRLVEHDMFLDGSNYTDPSLSVDRNVAVGEVQAGVAVSYRPNCNHRFDLTWGVTYLTDTFDAPGATGTESYGTFVLSWVKSF